ncbi:MAG: T9SS type A sorting domain-containing protein, partial [Chlorobi bacterium]|nr:T9SS type A sorting domain-containing protein [Chlorobiota bacterium]
MDYDGGSVSCINHNFFWVSGGKTDKKKNRTQFKEYDNYSFAVGTSLNGVYHVDYNRAIKTNDSLRDLSISAICNSYSGRYIYVATKNAGIYRNFPHFASVQELDMSPYALKISPNPAKSHASISFHNPEYADIEIAIYDLFGRKVADVHSGNLAEGDYNFSADLSGLASGSYFLRFGVGGRVGSLN